MSKITVNSAPWRKLRRRLRESRDLAVRVGVLGRIGGDKDRGGISMVALAAVHEFGSPAAGVPKRSFILRTVVQKRAQFARMSKLLTKAMITRAGFTARKALEALGLFGVSAVRDTITQGAGVPPPNEESTKKRKGSERPLVDTGQLVGSIAHEVVRKSDL